MQYVVVRVLSAWQEVHNNCRPCASTRFCRKLPGRWRLVGIGYAYPLSDVCITSTQRHDPA